MTQESNLIRQSNSSLPKHMLIGACIGMAMILFFILQADEPVPAEWGRLWTVKPLIVTPLAGAFSGLVFFIIGRIRQQLGWNKLVVTILSCLVFLVILWLGVVLGLNGTMWN
jgi:uncharacterized integral membrane protein